MPTRSAPTSRLETSHAYRTRTRSRQRITQLDDGIGGFCKASVLIFNFVDVRGHAGVNDADDCNDLAQLVNLIGNNVWVDWVVP